MILLIILKQNETRPDAVPNTAIYTYGSGNRLLSDASATTTNTYAYDGAGRLTNHVVNGQTRTFSYNFQGRMTSLTDIDGSVFAYEFDGEGNRLSQALNDCLSKRFVYDGADVLLELNPTNGVAYAWVNGPGIDQPIERLLFIDGSPRARRVFHSDALGSVAALTDPSGLVTQTYAYSAFGSFRSSTGHDPNRVTYTAREQLGDSQGWMYYRCRTLNLSCGRFTTPDGMGFVDGVNTWLYALGNPMIYSDALGLDSDNPIVQWFHEGDVYNADDKPVRVIASPDGKRRFEWMVPPHQWASDNEYGIRDIDAVYEGNQVIKIPGRLGPWIHLSEGIRPDDYSGVMGWILRGGPLSPIVDPSSEFGKLVDKPDWIDSSSSQKKCGR